MGATSEMPNWSSINKKTVTYNRQLTILDGNNKINKRFFSCDIKKYNNGELIKIWDINFKVRKYDENCFDEALIVKNTYYVDTSILLENHSQYHSDTLGYILLERFDR